MVSAPEGCPAPDLRNRLGLEQKIQGGGGDAHQHDQRGQRGEIWGMRDDVPKARHLARLPRRYRQIGRSAVYPVRYSKRLEAMLEKVRRRVRRAAAK